MAKITKKQTTQSKIKDLEKCLATIACLREEDMKYNETMREIDNDCVYSSIKFIYFCLAMLFVLIVVASCVFSYRVITLNRDYMNFSNHVEQLEYYVEDARAN